MITPATLCIQLRDLVNRVSQAIYLSVKQPVGGARLTRLLKDCLQQDLLPLIHIGVERAAIFPRLITLFIDALIMLAYLSLKLRLCQA